MNLIAKIINGKPVIFGTTGEPNEGSPVYIYTDKEEFDAAFAAGDIPDGALVIKTYDAAEAAGGPFDSELSKESNNAVQNKAITAELDKKANGPGITFSIEDGVLYASFDDGAGGAEEGEGNV